MSTASNADTSITPPRRSDTVRSRIPTRVATAATTPAMYSPWRPPAGSGGHPRAPRRAGPPDRACSVNSVAGRLAHGPVRPNGDTAVTFISPAAASSRSSGTGAPGSHRTASAAAACRRTASRSSGRSGWATSRSTPPASHVASGPSVPSGRGPPARHRASGCPSGGSTRVTSTPASTSRWLAYAPASDLVRSSATSRSDPPIRTTPRSDPAPRPGGGARAAAVDHTARRPSMGAAPVSSTSDAGTPNHRSARVA